MAWRLFKSSCLLVVALGLVLSFGVRSPGLPPGDDDGEPVWSLTIQGAPQIPQDVWISALGNNSIGWLSGGSICLGPLAQGFEVGEHVTLLTDVVAAGVVEDDTPVAEGCYVAPSDEIGDVDFEVVNGGTFYVIADAFIVNSNVDGFPVGITLSLMFTWDHVLGREVHPLAWVFLTSSGKRLSFGPRGSY